jgi:type II secretory pathway pseudopilin PulG
MLRRRGTSLFEMVVALTILAIVGASVFVATKISQSVAVDDDAIELAARRLSDLSEAIGLYTNTKAAKVTSFIQTVGANPRALSQLTSPISTNDRNSCGASNPLQNASFFGTSQVSQWAGQFYRMPLPVEGYFLAEGFMAQDTLKRYSTVFNPNGPPYFQEEYFSGIELKAPGTLAIVIPNVKYEDALALAQRFEGDQTGTRGAVRFSTGAPGSLVTVEFHTNIHGC